MRERGAVRAIFRYHLCGADYVQSSVPGFVLLAGAEFWRKKVVGLNVELGYDTSVVTIEEELPWGSRDKKVQAGGFLASVRAVF